MLEWKEYIGWMYDGVNTTIAGSGGPGCVAFLSFKRKLIESLVMCTLSLVGIHFSWQGIYLPKMINKIRDSPGRTFLLAILAMTFGIEVGFKLATRQFIWLLNPCHIITASQLYLLACPPNKLVAIIFRLHLYYLIGPIEALLIPVTSSRKHLFEKEIYYIQHILIFLTPHYLLKSGGACIPEQTCDYCWPLMALGAVYIYHFTILQLLSIALQVNLNNMICPASADPFYGPWYRVAAVAHQAFLMVLIGKLYPILSMRLSQGFWPQNLIVSPRHDQGENGNSIKPKGDAHVYDVADETPRKME